MPVRLLPDVETLAVNLLRASADVTELVSQRIGTTLYAGDAAALKVTLISGGERVRQHADATRIQIDAYGPAGGGGKAEALDLIRTARAWLTSFAGVRPEGVVNSIVTLVAPWWNPDEGFDPPRARYSTDLEIVAHPLPT